MTDNEPRELTPVQMFWSGNKNTQDFRPSIQKIDQQAPVEPSLTEDELREIAEAEEALTPVPKDSPAQESVPSVDSTEGNEPDESVTPALPQSTPPMPTQVTPQQPDVDSASGKDSEPNEDVPQTATPQPPAPATSSPGSSSETSRGKSTPPAVAKPPTSA